MYTDLKKRPRGLTSTVALLLSTSTLKVCGMHTILQQKINEKNCHSLSQVIKLIERFNTAQQVTATLTSPTVNMMWNNNRCSVCSRKGHIGCHCPDAQCYNYEDFGTLPRTVLTQSFHQYHHVTMTGHAPDCVKTTSIGTDASPLTTDTAKEDVLTSQDHAANCTAAEALATIRELHHTPHPTSVAVCVTHQLTNALCDTLTGTHHTSTTTTCLQDATFPTGVTLKAIPQTEVNLVQETHTILSTDLKR